MKLLKLIITFFFILTACRKDTIPSFDSATPNDFLSAQKYDKLIVEVQYVNGYQPTSSTISNLNSFLQSLLNKPGGIEIKLNSINAPGKTMYSLEDIQRIERQNRVNSTSGSTLAAYFFMCDGDYFQNTANGKILGIAYGNTSMVIFEKTIRDYSGGITQPSNTTLESTVIEHEFGHILGLVNNGTRMITNHQDVPNGRHCNNNNCLMYYATETSNIVANLLGNNIPVFDANCLADLKANGSK
jgi:hypothetical protein